MQDNPFKKPSPERDQQIVHMYREGMSLRDIASALGLSRGFVDVTLQKMGVEKRTRPEATRTIQTASKIGTTPPRVERDVIDAYLAGKRIEDIATSAHIAGPTVYSILRRHQIPLRGREELEVRENPVAREGEGDGLICMGRKVSFVMENGREIRAKHERDGMLYDESGHFWPKCSLLVTPFDDGDEEIDVPKGRDFYGRSTPVYEGGLRELPPKSLDAWRKLGEVKLVFYDRAGKYEGPFRHEFNKPRGLWILLWPFKKGAKKPAVLYSYGQCFRAELPEGCIVDDRGIVVP